MNVKHFTFTIILKKTSIFFLKDKTSVLTEIFSKHFWWPCEYSTPKKLAVFITETFISIYWFSEGSVIEQSIFFGVLVLIQMPQMMCNQFEKFVCIKKQKINTGKVKQTHGT